MLLPKLVPFLTCVFFYNKLDVVLAEGAATEHKTDNYETYGTDETCKSYLDKIAEQRCSKEKKFIIESSSKNWYLAKLGCEKNGYKLASIKSQKENDDLLNQCKVQGLEDPIVWTAGNDLAHEGNFTWASNINIPFSTFTNWAKGDPNNYYDDEDCVLISKRGWFDHDCLSDWNYACEYY